jgi:S-(hydroxymethyl)glutathione dehydrogenase/alcohol dehydrogenase
MVRPGGNVIWLGKVNVDTEVGFRWGSLMGERAMVRSSYGNARPMRDFPWLVDQYLAGSLKLESMTALICWHAVKASVRSSCSTEIC